MSLKAGRCDRLTAWGHFSTTSQFKATFPLQAHQSDLSLSCRFISTILFHMYSCRDADGIRIKDWIWKYLLFENSNFPSHSSRFLWHTENISVKRHADYRKCSDCTKRFPKTIADESSWCIAQPTIWSERYAQLIVCTMHPDFCFYASVECKIKTTRCNKLIDKSCFTREVAANNRCILLF